MCINGFRVSYFCPVKGIWARWCETDRKCCWAWGLFSWNTGTVRTPTHTANCLKPFVSLLSVVQKRSQQSICLSFQKEPELNHTSSTSRPSSSTSQAKSGEEKASLPTSLPKTVYDHTFTISGPNENARLIAFSFKLWHWFDSTGRPVDYSRTEPSSGGDHIIVTADNPAVTAPTMTHPSKWTFD